MNTYPEFEEDNFMRVQTCSETGPGDVARFFLRSDRGDVPNRKCAI